MAGGRPSDYTQEITDRICAELADGKSLRTVCKPDDMPSKTTVFSWLRKYPEFLNQYTRAKEESADALTDEMLDIADDGANDYTTEINQNGEEYKKVDKDHIQRSRLRIETRKWLASKLKPKKYGDKQYIETKDTTEELTDEQLNAKIQALLNESDSK